MIVPGPDAARLAEVYGLAVPETVGRGDAGERPARGTGASLEFQDRRTYSAGDDVRHLDWRAYARTDELLVRVFREEIQPRVDVLLDVSRSMAVSAKKAQLTVDLAALLVGAARAGSLAPRIVAVGDRVERVDLEHFERAGLALDAVRPVADALGELSTHLRPGSMRYLVSDFLTPHAPDTLVRALARNAGSLALVQVLSGEDRAPRAGSALRLVDAETGAAMDLVVDTRAVERYADRLACLESSLEEECRRNAALYVTLVADAPLEELARDRLAASGVLEPRR